MPDANVGNVKIGLGVEVGGIDRASQDLARLYQQIIQQTDRLQQKLASLAETGISRQRLAALTNQIGQLATTTRSFEGTVGGIPNMHPNVSAFYNAQAARAHGILERARGLIPPGEESEAQADGGQGGGQGGGGGRRSGLGGFPLAGFIRSPVRSTLAWAARHPILAPIAVAGAAWGGLRALQGRIEQGALREKQKGLAGVMVGGGSFSVGDGVQDRTARTGT